jgi:hypothetical protein
VTEEILRPILMILYAIIWAVATTKIVGKRYNEIFKISTLDQILIRYTIFIIIETIVRIILQ